MIEYGLLGEKLGHSFSPQLHKALAGYDYGLLPTPPGQVEDLFRRREFKGLNVTIPYKPTGGWLLHISPSPRDGPPSRQLSSALKQKK